MYYVRTKPGVKMDPLAPAGIRILAAVWVVAQKLKRDLLVSCGSEDHTPPSRHVAGEAIDVAVKGMDDTFILALRKALMEELGVDFTVLLEDRPPLSKVSDALRPYVTLNSKATALHMHLQPRMGTTYPPA